MEWRRRGRSIEIASDDAVVVTVESYRKNAKDRCKLCNGRLIKIIAEALYGGRVELSYCVECGPNKGSLGELFG